ncbi:hypothetical protein BHM03_00062264, partial [Ensete ventricosum]
LWQLRLGKKKGKEEEEGRGIKEEKEEKGKKGLQLWQLRLGKKKVAEKKRKEEEERKGGGKTKKREKAAARAVAGREEKKNRRGKVGEEKRRRLASYAFASPITSLRRGINYDRENVTIKFGQSQVQGLGWDSDGVIGNSPRVCRKLAEGIGSLLGWHKRVARRRPRLVGRLTGVAERLVGSWKGLEVDLWLL